MRVTPSPPKGEATQGEHPLDPRSRGIFINSVRGYRILGDALAAGAEARCAGDSKSDFLRKMCYILFIKFVARMGLYPKHYQIIKRILVHLSEI